MMQRVLFVCLGNICRSPTAEAVFLARAHARGLAGQVRADSAGTGDWHVGELADPRTRKTAERRGVKITHRARQLDVSDLARFDWIIVMDRSNLRDVRALTEDPDAHAKIHLFRSFESGATDVEVPDPYTGDKAAFDEVFEICERAADGLLDRLFLRDEARDPRGA